MQQSSTVFDYDICHIKAADGNAQNDLWLKVQTAQEPRFCKCESKVNWIGRPLNDPWISVEAEYCRLRRCRPWGTVPAYSHRELREMGLDPRDTLPLFYDNLKNPVDEPIPIMYSGGLDYAAYFYTDTEGTTNHEILYPRPCDNFDGNSTCLWLRQ